MVGGCSFMLHVRHAAAAIAAGAADVVLVTHGESGRSRVGVGAYARNPASAQGQFEAPFGAATPYSTFTVPALRFLHDRGMSRDDLAEVVVAQREWAADNPRAFRRKPVTVEQVLAGPPDRLPVHPGHVLRGDRRRRRAGADQRGAGRRPARRRARGLPAGLGRGQRGAADVADGRRRLVRRVPPGQRGGVRDVAGSATPTSTTSWATTRSRTCRCTCWRTSASSAAASRARSSPTGIPAGRLACR